MAAQGRATHLHPWGREAKNSSSLLVLITYHRVRLHLQPATGRARTADGAGTAAAAIGRPVVTKDIDKQFILGQVHGIFIVNLG